MGSLKQVSEGFTLNYIHFLHPLCELKDIRIKSQFLTFMEKSILYSFFSLLNKHEAGIAL